MKILVVGDTHGAKATMKNAIYSAKMQGATALVQVGDFGYWEHEPAGRYFLDAVSKRAVDADIPVFWIDGNHENHTLLRAIYGPGGNRHKMTADGFWEIRPMLYYVPRGTKWTWDGVTFMGVGGASSVDKGYRLEQEAIQGKPNSLWWPEEQVTLEDFDKAVAQGQADVLFTHDCPNGAPFTHALIPDLESDMHRSRMTELGRKVKPQFWFHGHYHMFMDYDFRHEDGYSRVISLECNGMLKNTCLFDTTAVK